MSDSADILNILAAMDAEAIDREAAMEAAFLAGDDAAFDALLNQWADEEFARNE